MLAKIGILQYFNFFTVIKINNKKIKIPIASANGYQHLIISEQWAIILYKKLLAQLNGTFIDVGVNNGQTLIKIKTLDSLRTYLGFEPNPYCYNYTRKLIQKNYFQHCLLFPVGLSNQNNLVPLFHDTEFASGASVLPDFRENKNRYKIVQHVALMHGDEIIKGQHLNDISILKIDVEGAEIEVLQGLQETIKKYRPIILLEILPVYSLEKFTGKYRYNRQQLLLEFLFSLQYQMYLIKENNVSLKEQTKIEVHGDMKQTNYLFVPREKKDIREQFEVEYFTT